MNLFWRYFGIFWILVGTALRFYHLDFQSFWVDEAASFFFISGSWSEFWQRIANDFHPPLYFLLLKLLFNSGFESDFALRGFSAAVSSVTLLSLWFITRSLYSEKIATVAACLFATSLYQIWFAQEVRAYALLGFFSLLSFAALLRVRNYTSALVHGLSLALVVHTHYVGLFLVLVHYFYLVRFRGTEKIKQLAVSAFFCGVLIIPIAPLFLAQQQHAEAAFWLQAPSLNSIASSLANLFSYKIGSLQGVFLGSAVFAVLIFSFRTPAGFIALSYWLLLVLASLLGVSQVFSDKTLAAVAPLVVIVAAMQVQRCFLVGWFFVLTLGVSSVIQYRWYYFKPHKEQWREAVQYIEREADPGDQVVFDARWTVVGFGRYWQPNKFGIGIGYNLLQQRKAQWVVIAHADSFYKNRLEGYVLVKKFVGIKIYHENIVSN